MTHMNNPRRVHPAAEMYAREFKQGLMDRREFLTRATALGLSAGAAYALGGLGSPAQAAAHAQQGGTMRIQQEVRAIKDPRTMDWTQISNFTRGWLEYMVEYNRDGSLRGLLLEGWSTNDNATEYTLNVRPGVTWNNGDPFTADDVVRMFEYWCDKEVEGNSMAGRMATLIDASTNKLIAGAVTKVDDMTVSVKLPAPDISIIVGMADYPAAVVHSSHSGDAADMLANPIGTGPYLPESLEVGVKGVLVRNENHNWWGATAEGIGGAYLDRIEYIDYGTDPASWISAVESDEVDMLYQNVNEFIDIADAIGWEKSEVVTGATVVCRFNQQTLVGDSAPYADVRVRQAVSQAVDNSVVLDLGYAGLGVQADNHHVAPVHPEYADIGRPIFDPAGSVALLEEAGMADFEHELITLDDGFTKNSGDAIAAQMRDAGISVKRTILPGSTFWNDWAKYPFSITEWNHRPLGVQVLALAYRSGEAWNESGYANPEFDALLNEAMSIADADARRVVMEKIETLFRNDAVIIQPYWRSLYRHYKAGVVGAEMHPSFEIHVYKLGFAA
ncbi:ABC transporter substrate-binding protein [Thalassococcus sp. CAU 1522]|uniref:ABC transporter substrate-binding protein n=1 Tax=Thalassococcus arenae TaxID=2851652 RepID=A0ABS6NAM6_9RHOB|nr:ABC transporter substrate-binding protein [Thalassococcus arenae]MBV2360838.1 ABC transporter substrate-binding protein [Thalassococcus arenae]